MNTSCCTRQISVFVRLRAWEFCESKYLPARDLCFLALGGTVLVYRSIWPSSDELHDHYAVILCKRQRWKLTELCETDSMEICRSGFWQDDRHDSDLMYGVCSAVRGT